MDKQHICTPPTSNDFRDGSNAGGCWIENGIHVEQIVGSSGVYLIETDIATGDVLRDSRPWQMRV